MLDQYFMGGCTFQVLLIRSNISMNDSDPSFVNPVRSEFCESDPGFVDAGANQNTVL